MKNDNYIKQDKEVVSFITDRGVEYEEETYYQVEDEKEERAYSDIRKDIYLSKEQYAINYINDLIVTGYIDLSPEFQRNEVWNDETKKSLFIESLFLNIPIPIFYAYDNGDSQLMIIDGKQRLSTIRDFLKNKFQLKNMKYLRKYNGCYFDDLPDRIKIDFNRYQCHFYVLNHNTPKRYLFDIFMRINTGGEPLKAQEIRNIFAKPKVRELLKKLSKCQPFLIATRKRITDDRMDAQELVLRYIALLRNYDFQNGLLKFKETTLSQLLENTIAALNQMDDFTEITRNFENACNRSYELFGEKAFSRLEKKSGKISRKSTMINRSLFTAVTVILSNSKYEYVDFKQYTNTILDELYYLLKNNGNLLTSATTSKTNTVRLFGYIESLMRDNIKC